MRGKTLVVVLGCAVVLGAGAVWLTQRASPVRVSEGPGGDVLFPQASARAGDVRRVRIQREGRVVELVLQEQGSAAGADGGAGGEGGGVRWVVASRGNYPALERNTLALIRAVLEARVVETKTAKPELYARLGVEDPLAQGAKGTLVSLLDSAGNEVASLIVGNRQDTSSWDTSKASTFVRPAGEAQSALVRGSFELGVEAIDWMDRVVLNLPREEVASVVVTHADGAGVTIRRASREEESYQVEGQGDRELADVAGPGRVLQSVASVSLSDVRARSDWETALGNTGEVRALFTLFDGRTFDVRVRRDDAFAWAAISPGVDEAARVAPADETPEQRDAALARVREQVALDAARLEPWAFAVEDFQASLWATKLEELLKPIAEPAAGTDAEVTPATDPAENPGDGGAGGVPPTLAPGGR